MAVVREGPTKVYVDRGDYGFHHYYNYERMLPYPDGDEYDTLGDLNHDNALLAYVTKRCYNSLDSRDNKRPSCIQSQTGRLYGIQSGQALHNTEPSIQPRTRNCLQPTEHP